MECLAKLTAAIAAIDFAMNASRVCGFSEEGWGRFRARASLVVA